MPIMTRSERRHEMTEVTALLAVSARPFVTQLPAFSGNRYPLFARAAPRNENRNKV